MRARLRFVAFADPFCRIAPQPLTPETLRKLSPWLDIPENWLLIDRDNRVVGISAGQLMGLEVAATVRGEIVLSHVRRVIALLEAGTWHHVNGSHSDVLVMLSKAFEHPDFSAQLTAAAAVLDIAMWARYQRRGAAFVLTPTQQPPGLSPPKYEVETFEAAATLLKPAEQPPENHWASADAYMMWQMAKDARHAQVALAVSVIGAGSGIDGATLLCSKTLRPWGFGAKIESSEEDFDVSVLELPVVPSAAKSVTRKSKLGGMRHQSAATLVYRNRDVTVVTVSQDGTVSLFVWYTQDEQVGVIKHIDRYLAAHPLRVLRPV